MPGTASMVYAGYSLPGICRVYSFPGICLYIPLVGIPTLYTPGMYTLYTLRTKVHGRVCVSYSREVEGERVLPLGKSLFSPQE